MSPVKVCAGFYTDMTMLLGKFIPLNTVRYADFAELWRTHKFSLIFCGMKSQRKLHYMIDEMTSIILKLWTPSSSFLEKVFAMYMLYAIYEVQPLQEKKKIRLMHHHWNMMMGEILQQSRSEQHLDVVYIIGRMTLTSCFHFVANLMPRTPARLGDLEDVTSTAEATTKVFGELGRLTKESLLEQLSMIHNEYTSMKAGQDHQGVKQLCIVKDNIFDEMHREVSMLQAKYRGTEEAVQNKSSSESSSEDKADSVSDTGARRRRLRMQQFVNKPDTRYSTRCMELLEREEAAPQVDASRASSSKEGLPSPPAKRQSRKKGKTSKKEADNHDPAPCTSAVQDATSEDQPQAAAASGSSRATKKGKKKIRPPK